MSHACLDPRAGSSDHPVVRLFPNGRAFSRRRFLCECIAGPAIALSGSSVFAARPAMAQSTLTSESALKSLMDGNARYVSGKLDSFSEDLQILKEKSAEKQEPFAIVLSCADSRVPVELIFDQSIGHVFVARVAGNVVTPEIMASIEYGVAVLGAKLIVVLAHSNCGAIAAAIAGKDVPGQISALYAPLRPAVEAAGASLDATVDANARIQAGLLRAASPVLAAARRSEGLQVIAARYDIATGKVTLLE